MHHRMPIKCEGFQSSVDSLNKRDNTNPGMEGLLGLLVYDISLCALIFSLSVSLAPFNNF